MPLSSRLRALLLVLLLAAAPAPTLRSGPWMQVARVGQEVPGTGGSIHSFLVSDAEEELRVGSDGSVWTTTGRRDESAPFGLLGWSRETGLTEVIEAGALVDGSLGLRAEQQWLVDTDPLDGVAVAVRSQEACAGFPSLLRAHLTQPLRTFVRCDDLAALAFPRAANAKLRSLGFPGDDAIVLELDYYERLSSVLAVPDDVGGYFALARSGGPAPIAGRVFGELGGGGWGGGRLVFRAFEAQLPLGPTVQPGDGDVIYNWSPAEGFTAIARADESEYEDPTSEAWFVFSNVHVSRAGYMIWGAAKASDPRTSFLLGSDGTAPPEILLREGDPVPGGGSDTAITFFSFDRALAMEPNGIALRVEFRAQGRSYRAILTREPGGGMVQRLPAWGWGWRGLEPFATAEGRLVYRTEEAYQSASTYGLLEPDGTSYSIRQLLPGDDVRYAPADFRRISRILATAFDRDLRYVAQVVEFEQPPGGSAVYVTTVPEPLAGSVVGTLALASLAGCHVCAARLRAR